MNIILIISDTFRYDNLFNRATMPVRTPHLDRFASRAVCLSRLYVSSFPTVPHRTDLTTGRYGWPWYPWQSRLKSSQNHIPEILREAGYVSQLLCDTPHIFFSDFNKGFDAAYAVRGQEVDTFLLRMNHPIPKVLPEDKMRSDLPFRGRHLVEVAKWTNHWWYKEADRFAPRTAGLTVEWLEENYQHHPFFLWVDMFDPHEPWDPPEYMVKKYDPDYSGTPMIQPNYGKADTYTPTELKNLRAHYCAEAELVDRWVGRILEKIDDLDLWKNSVVIFTTDHGFSIGEHNCTGKMNINDRDDRCWPIYPEIAHIPFMIAAPGLKEGHTVDTLIQVPDILPTVLDLTDVKVTPPEPFHGRSFAPLLKEESKKPLHDFVISGSFLKDKPKSSVTPILYTDKWAYVPYGQNEKNELYDIKKDPYAETNIASKHPKVISELHGKLLKWLDDIKAPQQTRAVFE